MWYNAPTAIRKFKGLHGMNTACFAAVGVRFSGGNIVMPMLVLGRKWSIIMDQRIPHLSNESGLKS
jgi:hypothetical protein